MEFKDNELHFGGIGAKTLAQKYGTPLYIYEAGVIRERYREVVNAVQYPHFQVHYAAKANSNLSILRLLRREGANVETVSRGSILLALKAGFKPSQIIYTSNGIDEEEIQFLIDHKVWVNLDSLTQVEKWGKLNPGSKISIRLNLNHRAGSHDHIKTGGSESKFGIHMSEIRQVKSLARKYNLTIAGIHQHIGSDILTSRLFIQAAKNLLKIAEQFAKLEVIDFGGGFGIPYKSDQQTLDIQELGSQLDKLISIYTTAQRKEVTVMVEPGRYLVAHAGTLLAKATDIKTNSSGTLVAINTGMGHLIRPALYDAYHDIVNASRLKGKNQRVTVVGNICESGDVLGKDRLIRQPREGDLLAILNAGAYGYTMSSLYNARVRPAEILVEDGKTRIIRKRKTLKESLSDF